VKPSTDTRVTGPDAPPAPVAGCRLMPGALTALTALAALLAALQLTGCASADKLPSALAPLPAAAAGLAGDTATPFPDGAWWRTLGDPALDALIDLALIGQPSLQAAAARLARAGAATDALRGAQGPQLGLGADVTRQRFTAKGIYPAPVAGNVYNSGNLQVTGSVELDFFGRHDAALKASLGQQQALRAELQAARVLLAANVARGYVGLARLFSLREVAERTLAQREAMLGLTRQRVAGGVDTRVELRLAETSVPDARSQIEAMDGQIALARHQLAVLSGQPPQALDGLKPALGPLPAAVMPQRLGADLLGRRADVVAARWRVNAALHEVDTARLAFYPDINLVGFVGLNALGLDRLFDGASRNLGITPALRLPLFDGGRLNANLRGRAADADAAVAAYNGAVLDAAREVLDAGATLQSLARQQAEQAQALTAAESAYDLARQRYGAGLGSFLTVLNAESGVLAQRWNAAELKARALDTQVTLMRALGGGWRDDAPPPMAAR
jgi:NodT family efflux transporter outer membrane factor (OMF) lipoprotein